VNWVAIALIIGGYLYGAAPFVWLIARAKGINLRLVGTGNIGASNLAEAAGTHFGVVGALLDFSKGLLPVLLGYYILHLETEFLCLAGIAATVGQIWPVFLKFSGGRGTTAAGSVETAFFIIYLPSWFSWMILIATAPLIGATIWRNLRSRQAYTISVPLLMLVTFILVPLLTWLWGDITDGNILVLTFTALLLVMIIRRLTAGLGKDLRGKPDTQSTGNILLNRFLYDRSYR
jgi:glycerol-3-phosphate acyltransferase PlsY